MREIESTVAPLLSLPRTQEILGLSGAGLARIIRSGELPVVQIGGRTLVQESDLATFIAVRRVRRGGPGRPRLKFEHVRAKAEVVA